MIYIGSDEKQSKGLTSHCVTALNRDEMIRQWAFEKDIGLIATLSERDMTSRDACYPHKCITGFTNSYRSFVNDRNKNGKDKQKRCEEIAILEVLNYIEETLEASPVISPYLKLSDVKKYYCQVLQH